MHGGSEQVHRLYSFEAGLCEYFTKCCPDPQLLPSRTFLLQKIGERCVNMQVWQYFIILSLRPLLPLAAECIAARSSILQVAFQRLPFLLRCSYLKAFSELALQNKAFQLQLCELALKLNLLDL